MNLKYLLSIILLFSCIITISAQDESRNGQLKTLIATLEDESMLSTLPFYHYLENSIGGSTGKFPFALDGHISAHFYLFDQEDSHPITKHFMIDINPQVDMRIIRVQESVPVRTPSYKPGAKLHYLKSISLFGNLKIKNFFIGYLHHSNGQDGNSIAELAKPDIRDDLEYINDSHHYNVYNGDFALNFVPVGFDLYWYKKRSTVKPNASWLNLVKNDKTKDSKYALSSTAYLLRFNYDIHVGNPKTPLEGYYSFYRPSIQFKMIRNVKRYPDNIQDQKESELDRLNFKVSWGFGKMDLIENYNLLTRLNADISYHVKIPQSSNIAVMIHVGYQGSDPYNIYLEDKNIFIKLGMSTGRFLYQKEIGGL